MAGSVEIGSAYLSIVPSARGIGKKLSQEISGEMTQAGQDSGRNFGNGLDNSPAAQAGATFGAKLGNMLKTGALAALAGLGLAIKEAFAKEDANAVLRAQLGATVEDGARYGKIAGEAYRGGFGASYEEVTKTVSTILRNVGRLTDTELQSLTQNISSIATTFGKDANEISRAIGVMLKSGIADSASSALDLLTKGLQNGLDAAGDLSDTFTEYPIQFRELGLSAEQSLGILSQSLKAGARDSDFIADALKEFAIRAQDASATSMAAFSALGLNGKEMTRIFAEGGPQAAEGLTTVLQRLREMSDPVARNTAAVQLFGTKAEDLQDALYAIDPSTAVAGLGKVAGAAQDVSNILGETATARATAFYRNLKTNLVDFLGGTVIPALQKAGAWIKNTFGSLFDDVGKFVSAIFQGPSADTPEWMVSLALAVRQLGDVLGGIGTAVKEQFLPALAQIMPVIAPIIGWLVSTGLTVFKQFAIGMVQGATGLLQALSGLLNFLKGIFSGDWSMIWVGLKNLAVGFFNSIVGLFASVLVGGFRQAMSSLGAWISGAWNSLWSGLKSTASSWGQSILSGLSSLVSGIWNFFRSLPGQILSALGGLGNLLYNAGRDMINGMIRGLRDMAANLWNEAKRIAQEAANWVKRQLGISSPSKVFMEIGEFMMQGMTIGLERTAHLPQKALNEALSMGNMVPEIPGVSVGGYSFDASARVPTLGTQEQVTLNVYPNPGQSEESIGAMAIRQLALRGRLV